MPMVLSAIMPHGSGAIPGFTEGGFDFKKTRAALYRAGRVIQASKPDVVVLATPHNLRIARQVGVISAEHCSGSLSEGRRKVTVDKDCDVELARRIYLLARSKGVHAALVNYGTDSGPASNMPLDWGTVVPMYFLPRVKKVVVLTPSRELPWTELVSLGECVAEASKGRGRVVFIASADQAHAHSKDGPYGYSKSADEYDRKVMGMIRGGDLTGLLEFKKGFLGRAKPDSFWQMLILLGVQKGRRPKVVFSEYDCPSYFGMATAVFS